MFKNKNIIFLPWLLFALGITSLGVLAYQKKFDLVTENYYAAELDHSNTMEMRKRGMAFSGQIDASVRNGSVEFVFPANFRNNKHFSGEIRFYRPSDVSLDTSFYILPNENLRQSIPANTLKKGYWELEYKWSIGDMKYLLNDTITL